MNPRKLLRIARWEMTKNAGGVDRRTLAVVVVAIALLGLAAPLVAGGGVGVDDGLYRVAVEEENPYHDVVAGDDTFRVVSGDREALERGDVELLIEGGRVERGTSAKARAAHDEFRDSVERYNNRQLGQEANRTAAFPVSVVLEFRQQTGLGEQLTGAGNGDPDDTGGETDTSDDDAGGANSDGDGGDPGDGESADDGTSDPGLGGLSSPFGDDRVTGSPADIDPPFPFQSLVLAFVFVIPLNFIIQAYGSTMLSERINRRGELLLVSPVTRTDIIGGKTLPYFLGAMLLEGAIAVGLVFVTRGELGGLTSILAVAPLVALFLGATFLGAMFARSFKELTFVTVTITVSLTAYAFVPAIFTDVNAIALISPLTLVVRNLQAEPIAIGEFVFSTVPPTLTAVVLFGLGAGLYREEDMFDQRSIRGKVLDALAGPISRPFHVGVVTAVLIPFVFVVQLLAIALLFPLGGFTGSFPVEISVLFVLVVVAVVEELAKSLHVYAAYEHRRFPTATKTALLLGVTSGIGFFLAEKIALLAQLVGLEELRIGEAGLQGGVITDPTSSLLVLGLFLLAPLALHVVTAAISAVGASRGKRPYLVAVTGAMAVHFLYNFTVVVAVA
ncbi:MAG: PrsW family intramembrane metalloprotease [Halovenus sp.]